MRIAHWLIEAGKALVELGDHLNMQDARLDSLGCRREPQKEMGEITDTVREAIIKSRAECSEEDWLRENGRRDQECVRYGIATEQAAAILAGATKREKKNGNGNGSVVTAPTAVAAPETLTSPAQKVDGKNIRNMFDPNEWGVYPLEKGGSRDRVPEEVCRTATETDKNLVVLIHKIAKEHNQDWRALRTKFCCTRRLTRQQVAAIIAEHTRLENKKFEAGAAHA